MNKSHPATIPHSYLLLGLVLLVALGMRLWGIMFDLPYITSSREHLEVGRALELGMGQFNFSRIGKGGLFYILFVEYGVLYLILRLLGTVESAKDFALYYMQDVSPFWILGRMTSVIMGVISVFLIYRLGKGLYNQKTGLLAAFFLAVYPVHVHTSHFILVDVPMVMFSIATFYGIFLMAESGKPRHYIVAGLMMGLAIMNKFPAVVLMLPYLMVHYSRVRMEQVPLIRWVDQRLILGLGTMGLIYVVGAPGLLLYPSKLIGVTTGILQGRISSGAYSGETPNLWLLYFVKLYQSLGAALFLIFILGIIRSFFSTSYVEKGLGAFCLAFYVGLCISSFREWSMYYLLPVIPFGLLLAARTLEQASEMIGRYRFSKATVYAVLLILTGLPLTYLGIVEAREFGRPNTQLVAKDWIEKNIRPGSKILLHGFPGLPYTQSVPIKDLPENLVNMAIKAEAEDKTVKATYLRLQSSVTNSPSYDLVSVHTRRLRWESPEYYREQGIEYLILSRKYFDDQEDIQYSKESNERRSRFYRQLKEDPSVSFVKDFDPSILDARGPFLELIKIK